LKTSQNSFEGEILKNWGHIKRGAIQSFWSEIMTVCATNFSTNLMTLETKIKVDACIEKTLFTVKRKKSQL